MKGYFKKYNAAIFTLIAGIFLGATIIFPLRSLIPSFSWIISGSLALATIVVFVIIEYRNYKEDHREVTVEGEQPKEGEEGYKSPFPDIDHNPAQSEVINSLYTYLMDTYGFFGDLEINEMGTIIIGAHAYKKGEKEEDAYFVPISNLVLPPPELKLKDPKFPLYAQKILEKFEDDCKIALGDYKK